MQNSDADRLKLLPCLWLLLFFPVSVWSISSKNLDQCGIHEESGFFGRMKVGMTIFDVKTLDLPKKFKTLELEGDSYAAVDVFQCTNGTATGIFDAEGTIVRIETLSPNFLSAKNVGVGSIFRSIRAAYPNGRLIYGTEEGRYLRYVTGTRLIFDFSPSLLPLSCYGAKRIECEISDFDIPRKIILDKFAPN